MLFKTSEQRNFFCHRTNECSLNNELFLGHRTYDVSSERTTVLILMFYAKIPGRLVTLPKVYEMIIAAFLLHSTKISKSLIFDVENRKRSEPHQMKQMALEKAVA